MAWCAPTADAVGGAPGLFGSGFQRFLTRMAAFYGGFTQALRRVDTGLVWGS